MVVESDAAVERVVELACASSAPAGMAVRVVAIDGPGGAGKTTLAALVAARLDDAPIVHTDDFASWSNPLDWYGRLVEQVLRPLAEGAPARYQRFDWDADRLAEWHEVTPRDFLIIEGVSASRDAFRPYLAVTVWVETGRDERLRRGLERDGEEALGLWESWMREEDDYVARERPDRRADLVVRGEAGGA
jgi:uridine kinase